MQLPMQIQNRLGTFPALSPSEYERRRCRWLNEEPGTLTGLDCPICKNKGFVAIWDEEHGHRSVECECMAKRRSLKRIERSGLKEMLSSCTFDSFRTDAPWQQTMKDTAREFLSDNTGAWFVAAGAVGAGKSHICTAICGELMSAGKEVRYMLWRDEAVRLKAAVNDEEEYSRLLEPLKRVKVLYIDDFLKTQRGKDATAADINLAFELLNFRYINRNLVTIISSEKTVEEIVSIDEATGSRIFERCKGYYLKLTGTKNQRLQR